VILALVLAVTSEVASASEGVSSGVPATRKIVVLNDAVVRPSALTMEKDDVLEFENASGQVMTLVFVEPTDQETKIRCYLTDHTIARPDQSPWLLFSWGPGRHLTATIPPGRFASQCSLAPGRYAFVTRHVERDPRGAEASLGTKGTITVE
jgi:hypothetical protein